MGANKTKPDAVKEKKDSNKGVIKTESLHQQKVKGSRIGVENNSPNVTQTGKNAMSDRPRRRLSPIPVQEGNYQMKDNGSGENIHSAQTTEFSLSAQDVQSKTVNSREQICAVEMPTHEDDHEVAIKVKKENKISDSAQHSPIQSSSRTDTRMLNNKRNRFVETEPCTTKLTYVNGSNEVIDDDKTSENKYTEHKPVAEHEIISTQIKEETVTPRKKKKKNPLKRESEKKKLKVKVSELEQKLINYEKEIEDLKTRLSRSLGDRLTDNNPNIADLSDMNRPTKIAERFSELYDNQWTNLFEQITAGNKMEEKEAIHFLLEKIKTIYNNCHKQSIDGYDRLQSTAAEFTGLDLEELSRGYAHWLKVLKDRRKHNYLKFLDQLTLKMNTEFEGSVPTSIINSTEFKEYSALATELCWLMCIQDPPVVMVTDCRRGKRFDKSLFRAYKRQGEKYSYPVWPALLLHTGGGLLMKGVAQPKKGVHALFN